MTEVVRLRLTGVAPLLMHSGRLADPLDPHAQALSKLTSKRAKTSADHHAIARVEWRGGLWLLGGAPCVPAEAVESALVRAARSRRAGSAFRAAVAVRDSSRLHHDGPDDLDRLWEDERFRHRCGVRVGTRTTIRTRARFDRWAVTTEVAYDPRLVDRGTLLDVARFAGDVVGLGDWRPRFGRFGVEALA